jgi:hypothetical protein
VELHEYFTMLFYSAEKPDAFVQAVEEFLAGR